MKASRGAREREREKERSELLAGRMDAVVRWYRRRGTVYAPPTCTPYKDTPYSDWWINAVRERRGPRYHLSLWELIKAESAAR